MNKKIKLIELLQKSANKEELPKKIYFDGIIFELDEDGTYKGAGDLLVDSINFNLSNLNDYVEILEDNTEEQESLGESWKEMGERAGEWAKEFQKGFTESFSDIILGNKEDNTEEIEELPDCNYSIKENRDKINELVKAVNDLRKEKE